MYFQMKYDSKVNEYLISPLDLKGIDRSKISDEVLKYSTNIWVCRNKKGLISFAEEHKDKKIFENEEILKKIRNRTINVIRKSNLDG